MDCGDDGDGPIEPRFVITLTDEVGNSVVVREDVDSVDTFRDRIEVLTDTARRRLRPGHLRIRVELIDVDLLVYDRLAERTLTVEYERPDDDEVRLEATVSIRDQESDGTNVVVSSTSLSEGGFLVVHDASLLDGATFDSVRGSSSYLRAGSHSDIQIHLNQRLGETQQVIVMPHLDTDDDRELDFVDSEGADDGPYTDESGNIVLDDAMVTVDTDADNDGLDDAQEMDLGTDPDNPDTDGDGLADGRERRFGTDPLNDDTDDDGLNDATELQGSTDPTAADTDGDGIDDPTELQGSTNPAVGDTDGDGIDDGAELERGTDPLAVDTDEDGLDDVEERDHRTNPLSRDTDGDGLSDREEVDLGSDPGLADTDRDYLPDDVDPDPTNALIPFGVVPLLAVFVGIAFRIYR